MAYTKDELRKILDEDFMQNENAFAPGRTNDDMVDSMCICFALDEDWSEFFNKWMLRHIDIINGAAYLHGFKCKLEKIRIEEHQGRVDKWLYNKWICNHYQRGETDIMTFAINY